MSFTVRVLHHFRISIATFTIVVSDNDRDQVYFKFNYELQDKKDSILFKGFEASHPISEVSGEKRLKYHRDQPYEKYVPFFRYSKAVDSVVIPEYYIVGGECDEVIDRLRSNQVEMMFADEIEDSLMTLHILNFKSPKQPYEGHFLHSKVEVGSYPQKYDPKPGDVIVRTDQRNRRFILSVLEPQARDSYFAWNFFDGILQRKEYFSPYVFEELALEILKDNPTIKEKLEAKKKADEKGFYIGMKVVRGAYMEKERERAEEMGYPSPICKDKGATDENFNAAITYMTSGSDPRKRDQAKSIASYVVIGLIVIWAAPAIVGLLV